MLTIKEILRQLLQDGTEIYSKVCKVLEVEGNSCTVEPINGDADVADVRLVADDAGGRVAIQVPKIGSMVIVTFLTADSGFISMVSEVDEVRYKIGDTEYSATADGFLIKKQADTLKEALTLLIEAVMQIMVLQGNNPDYEKLTQAKQKITNLLR